MATINGSTNNNQWTFKLEVSEGSYNITNNTSPVTVSVYLGRSSSTSYIGGNWSGNITVDGSSQSINGTITYPTYINAGEYILLATKTFTVSHNNDGSKTASVSSSISSSEFTPSYASANGNVTLATIPRASDIACSSPYIGDTATITIDKKSSEFVNDVKYKIGSIENTIAAKTSQTVLSLKTSSIEDQIYALIPSSREVQGTIYCTTYRKGIVGYIKVGDTKSATFNLYAKESVCKPVVSATAIDTNEDTVALTGSNEKFIKYISKPKVTITALPQKSATIKSYSINLNDGQVSNSQENTFNSIGSNSVTVSTTDSRGYSNSVDSVLDMIDYIKLHIDSISLERTEDISNEIVLNANGVFFNNSFNESNTNTLSVKFQYRKSGETEWSELTEITPTIENNTFKFSDYSLGNIYSFDDEYQFKVVFNDLLMIVGNLDSDVITVPKGQEVIAVGEDSVWVYGDLFLNDNYIIESGSNENGEYIKFVDGTMICKKTIAGTTPIDTSWGSLYESPDISLGDFALPFIEPPRVFATNGILSGKFGHAFFIEWIRDITNTSFGTAILVRPISSSAADYNIQLFAIGKWK